MKIRGIIGIVSVAMIATLAVVPVHADTYGGGSVQGYSAEAPLETGTVVQLAAKDANRVKVASQAELQNMFGVTVDRNQLPVTLTNENLVNQVYVASSGTYNVLVSTQGGAIASGDYVTLSAINGVVMKAGTEEKTVFGRANAGFDGKTNVLGTSTLKDASGNTNQTVSLGMVPVTINIQRNPNIKSTKANLPEQLQRIGQAIAEKEVSPIRIYLSIAIAIISVIATIVILYAGIRNSIISIGRNPMSKKSIFRALVEVVLTSIVILTIGVFAVYLLLKL